jgi:hypothetical protein
MPESTPQLSTPPETVKDPSDIIFFGPDTWTENRTDGVVTSITVLLKGWKNTNISYLAEKTITVQGDGEDAGDQHTVTPIDSDATPDVSASFTINIPAEHQTTATWHNHIHPHDLDNDTIYSEKSRQWVTLIKASSEYQSALSSLESQLESL